jgi:sulfur relay (sulfurtransferase) DsrC/TusE family protein
MWEMIAAKKNQAIKITKEVHGVIEYSEKQFEKYNLCPCCAKFLSKTVRLVALRRFKFP